MACIGRDGTSCFSPLKASAPPPLATQETSLGHATGRFLAASGERGGIMEAQDPHVEFFKPRQQQHDALPQLALSRQLDYRQQSGRRLVRQNVLDRVRRYPAVRQKLTNTITQSLGSPAPAFGDPPTPSTSFEQTDTRWGNARSASRSLAVWLSVSPLRLCWNDLLVVYLDSVSFLFRVPHIGSSAWNAHSTLAFPTNQNLSLCQRFYIQYQHRAITTFPLRRPSWPHSQSDFLLQQISAFLCPSLAESAIIFVHNARQHS